MDTKYWMFIYGLQLPFQILAILLHTFYFSEDSIEFCIKNGDKDQALKGIAKVYKKESRETHLKIYQE